jgi:tartrate-resistant acid phosphatase type 5
MKISNGALVLLILAAFGCANVGVAMWLRVLSPLRAAPDVVTTVGGSPRSNNTDHHNRHKHHHHNHHEVNAQGDMVPRPTVGSNGNNKQAHHRHRDKLTEPPRKAARDSSLDDDAVDSSDSSDSAARDVVKQRHHKHEKRHHGKGNTYNVNDPDDMNPARLQPVHIQLDANRNRSYVSFHVLGDWGGPGRQPQRDVASAMGKAAAGGLKAVMPPAESLRDDEVRLERAATSHRHAVDSFSSVFRLGEPTDGAPSVTSSIDFVISTGDNMYEDGVADEFDKRFGRNFENVYTHPALTKPRWYMSLGNHDHGAHGVMRDVRGQVRYTNRSKRWFLPSTYYVQRFVVHQAGVDAEGDAASAASSFTLDLVVLDVYDVSPFMTKISSRQLKWLNETLESSAADWKIVVGHRPIYSGGKKHGSSPYMADHVLVALKAFGVAAYFSGDDHDLQVLESDGVLLAISGGGSRGKNDLKPVPPKQSLFQAGVHGFMNVQLSQSHIALSCIDKQGEVLFRTTRARDRRSV